MAEILVNHMDNLPLEVLEHIMGFLDKKTRKIARQVSKKWCKACRGFKKIVIRDVYADCVDKILEILEHSDNRFEEIEFHCVDLEKYQCSNFWERWGHRITSLQFYDTRLSPEIFLNMIVKSPRLTHINMHWSLEKRHLGSFHEIMCLLDNFIPRNLKNNSVISLDISVPRSSFAQFFERIFNVFPNIKMLKIFYWERMAAEDVSFITRQTITWKEQLEVLSLRSFTNPGFEWKTILLGADLIRLKEIHLNVTGETSIEHLTQFIGKLPNLEHLNVEVGGYGLYEGLSALQDFVFSHKSCRKLKVFRLIGPVKPILNREFFDFLSKSPLHTLVLDCFQIELISAENFLSGNKTLKNLQLTERYPKDREHYNCHMIFFIRAFRGLEKLELAGVSAEIMAAVNQYQSGLRVFRTFHKWFGGFRHAKIEPPVSNLPNLVDVEELSIFTRDGDFQHRFLSCIRLHLRYLYVEESMNFRPIFKLLPNAPFLETLIIKVDDDVFLEKQDIFIKTLNSLKHLKYLWICMPDVKEDYFVENYFFEDDVNDTEDLFIRKPPPRPCNEFANQIFEACPSLRIFIFGKHLYFYSIIKKCVNLKRNAFNSGADLINNSLNFKNNVLGKSKFH